MTERDGGRDRLEQQLRDERRRRDAAERRLAEQAEKAAVWRRRAEERTQRIERLVAERDQRLSLGGRLRANLSELRSGPRVPPPPPEPDEPPRPVADEPSTVRTPAPRRLAHLRVAHLVEEGGWRHVVEQTADADVAEDPSSLLDADLVLLTAAAWASAPAELRARIEEWSALPARQPLVWVDGPQAPRPALEGEVLRLGEDDPLRRATFDPVQDTPVGRDGTAAAAAADGDAEPWDGTDVATVVAAARARAVPGAEDPVREGDRRRRHAWAHHHPGVLGAELAQRVGLSFEEPRTPVAALLVSNRPDDLREQLPAMLEQLHRPLALHVGCHGFSSSEISTALDAVGDQLPLTVTELSASEELGRCLNRVAEGSNAPVLAKIDDDDHYGPGYLLDAVQALEYARAAMVGRLCAFTHLEGQGRTVLRRPGGEEQLTDSALIGATMVFRRDAWERAPFPHRTIGEDTGLQRGFRALGLQVYVASRWDFVYRRGTGGNTWQASDEHFLAGSLPAWDGWSPERADLAPW